MTRLYIILMLVFFYSGINAQSTNVSKSDLYLVPGTVEITAQAIPGAEAGNVVIDSSTYHKAVPSGYHSDIDEHVIEISAPAMTIVETQHGSPKIAKGKTDPAQKQPVMKTVPAVRLNPDQE